MPQQTFMRNSESWEQFENVLLSTQHVEYEHEKLDRGTVEKRLQHIDDLIRVTQTFQSALNAILQRYSTMVVTNLRAAAGHSTHALALRHDILPALLHFEDAMYRGVRSIVGELTETINKVLPYLPRANRRQINRQDIWSYFPVSTNRCHFLCKGCNVDVRPSRNGMEGSWTCSEWLPSGHVLCSKACTESIQSNK